MKKLFAHIVFTILWINLSAQVIPVQKFYDKDSLHIKESFFVLKSNPSLLDSTYISYYFNGNKKREGKYKNNEAIGDWLFYYESENLRMKGPLVKNLSNGYWRYYFENGNLKMEGKLVDNKKHSEWIYYHENGKVKSLGDYKNDLKNDVWIYNDEEGQFKAQAEYVNGKGTYYEFFDDGVMKMTGPIENEKSNGLWKYYRKDGSIESQGIEKNGLKQGEWSFYYPAGTLKSTGEFNNGKSSGEWKYYYENGNIKAEGKKNDDYKTGYWKVMFETGSLQSEANYNETETGDYNEYYPSGKLKITGKYIEGKNDGIWKYYYEDGKLEGECNFDRGIGYYKGYTPDNKLKIEGKLDGTEKVGTWIMYNESEDIAGYYHTYDNNDHPVFAATVEHKNTLPSGNFKTNSKNNRWKNFRKTKFAQAFKSSNKGMDAIILSTDPLSPVLSKIGLKFEYLVGKKYGHELSGDFYKKPFFQNHNHINNLHSQGFDASYKFKFYAESILSGYVHFDNEIRFAQKHHSVDTKIDNIKTTYNIYQNSYEYSFTFGNRFNLSKKQFRGKYSGLTLDAFIGLGVGFNQFDYKNLDSETIRINFSELHMEQITIPIRIGFTIGYSF